MITTITVTMIMIINHDNNDHENDDHNDSSNGVDFASSCHFELQYHLAL
jgi:hypothetical protein